MEHFVNTLKDDEAQDISDRTILFVEDLLDDSISSEEPMLISDNETLVYMIYTSGSTGKVVEKTKINIVYYILILYTFSQKELC